jgi:hypothetical protein
MEARVLECETAIWNLLQVEGVEEALRSRPEVSLSRYVLADSARLSSRCIRYSDARAPSRTLITSHGGCGHQWIYFISWRKGVLLRGSMDTELRRGIRVTGYMMLQWRTWRKAVSLRTRTVTDIAEVNTTYRASPSDNHRYPSSTVPKDLTYTSHGIDPRDDNIQHKVIRTPPASIIPISSPDVFSTQGVFAFLNSPNIAPSSLSTNLALESHDSSSGPSSDTSIFW